MHQSKGVIAENQAGLFEDLTPPVLIRGVERTNCQNVGENSSIPAKVDWLSFTWFPYEGLGEGYEAALFLWSWLGLDTEGVQVARGRYNYRSALHLPGGHIEILFDGQAGMGIHAQLTGQGVEEYLAATGLEGDWAGLLECLEAFGCRISRLDVALDDRSQVLDLATMVDAFQAGRCVTRYHLRPIAGAMVSGAGPGVRWETLNFGDVRQAESAIRIYDKRVERIAKGFDDPGPWVRVELVVRGEQVRQFVDAVRVQGWAAASSGAVLAKLDFKEVSSDSHVRRRDTVFWWVQFLGRVVEVPLGSRVAAEQSISRKLAFLERQASRALYTVMLASDSDPAVLDNLLACGRERATGVDVAVARRYLESGLSGVVALPTFL